MKVLILVMALFITSCCSGEPPPRNTQPRVDNLGLGKVASRPGTVSVTKNAFASTSKNNMERFLECLISDRQRGLDMIRNQSIIAMDDGIEVIVIERHVMRGMIKVRRTDGTTEFWMSSQMIE